MENLKKYKEEWLSKGLYGSKIAYIDFETTGLIIGEARVVSVAIVHLELGKGEPEVVYSQVINPQIPIPKVTSKIHGIYDQDVVDKPTFLQQLPDMMIHLQNRFLAAYNLPFDWGMLDSELRRTVGVSHPFIGICGKVLAMAVCNRPQGKGNHKLVNVCKQFGVPINNHDAESDALAGAKLLQMHMPKLGIKFGEIREYWAWQREYAIQKERELRRYFRTKNRKSSNWPWTEL
jgi:DNA polymerase III epsilon subunit-like protein|tara:strand:- start:1011 stop:1709 length:699 start_codon:yes stop_codon:yes gene_type:complete